MGSDKVYLHFFLNNKEYASRTVAHVPRAGDEIRLADEKLYTVFRLVWCMDHLDMSSPRQRVNIEIKPIEE